MYCEVYANVNCEPSTMYRTINEHKCVINKEETLNFAHYTHFFLKSHAGCCINCIFYDNRQIKKILCRSASDIHQKIAVHLRNLGTANFCAAQCRCVNQSPGRLAVRIFEE